MPPPLVTIVTPTYNQERFVAACIESALAQRYEAWEQIVVDDGSDDRTAEIVASYGDTRVRLLRLPHRGLGALAESYNAALAASGGELVGILEGDDRWPADKLERQVPLFEDPRTLLTWGRATTIGERGERLGERRAVNGRGRRTPFDTAEAFRRLTRSNFLTPSVTVMVRRAALDRIGGFVQTGSALYVDLPTWLRISAEIPGQVEFLDEILGEYRVHPSQTTRAAGGEMARQHLEAVLRTLDRLEPAQLERMGGGDALRRRAVARGALAKGEALLAAKAYRDARAAFREALRRCADLPDCLLAIGGIGSALLHTDLVRRAFSVRERLQRLRRS